MSTLAKKRAVKHMAVITKKKEGVNDTPRRLGGRKEDAVWLMSKI